MPNVSTVVMLALVHIRDTMLDLMNEGKEPSAPLILVMTLLLHSANRDKRYTNLVQQTHQILQDADKCGADKMFRTPLHLRPKDDIFFRGLCELNDFNKHLITKDDILLIPIQAVQMDIRKALIYAGFTTSEDPQLYQKIRKWKAPVYIGDDLNYHIWLPLDQIEKAEYKIENGLFLKVHHA